MSTASKVRTLGIRTMLTLSLVAIIAAPLVAQETVETKEPREYLRDLQKHMADQDLAKAKELMDEALDAHPEADDVIIAGCQVLTQYGVDMAGTDRKAANKPLRRAAEIMRGLAERRELNGGERRLFAQAIYNEACCAAVDEQADETFALLEEAISLGFSDSGLLKSDTDFKAVRDDERFEKMLELIEEQKEGERESKRPS